jgi:2-methylaconitate cis-trans-isomerase PrpF
MGQVAVPAAFWRGGTSRAVLFKQDDLAGFDARKRDRIILAALGSPDPGGRQVDGLGGGISSLSKVCVLGWTGQEVTFTFGQVDVLKPLVDWTGTCGNMSAAVGPFAIEAGWVEATSDLTEVPVLATNVETRFIAQVPTPGCQLAVEGDYAIDGVPGPGARIQLKWLEPGGTQGRGALPTGQACQVVDGVDVSIVDVANPCVFLRAADVGLTGTETPLEIETRPDTMARLEHIRAAAAELIGLGGAQAIPKIAVLAAPSAIDIDVVARAVSMERIHRTFPATAAMCLAAAAALPGTIAHELATPDAAFKRTVRIAHPAGAMDIGVEVANQNRQWIVCSATTSRTARKIMDGHVYVPSTYLSGGAWFDR